jgi:hypothetical protein
MIASKKKRKSVARKEQSREADNKQFSDGERTWHPKFSTFRKVHDSKRLVEVMKELDAFGDNLRLFCAAAGNIGSRFEVEVLENFCRGTLPTGAITGKSPAGHQKIVWIDDRNRDSALKSSGDERQHENPLTATGLFRALEEPRFDHKDLPNAARRLIYITDLSPACIHALVGTVSWHQAPTLRDTISKHLAFQTAIAAKITSDGIAAFQLDLHLSFFILDKTLPPKDSSEKFNTKPRRRWSDLSFLKWDMHESEDKDQQEVWGIQEAHISCAITGFDDYQWVAYGFVDTEVDGVLADSSPAELSGDQIAAGRLPISPPLWCPREYWLKVFEFRIDYVRLQWHYLIQKLEPSVDQYVRIFVNLLLIIL